MSALTHRQRLFVAEYLVDLNAAGAARRAGYSGKSAGKYGPRLLLHPPVAEEVQRGMVARQERMARLEITQDRVVEELARVAFGDLRELAEWGPDGLRLRASDELSAAQAAVVCEVTEGSGRMRIKRHDKLKALELLGKHLCMFRDGRPSASQSAQSAQSGKGIIERFMEALRGNDDSAGKADTAAEQGAGEDEADGADEYGTFEPLPAALPAALPDLTARQGGAPASGDFS